MNNLEPYADVFAGVLPWAGHVPRGYLVDFLGTLTDAKFRTMFGVDPDAVGGGYVATRLPTIEDGEGWFEAANWFLAAREARGRFVMVTLGACYGAQAVGSAQALRLVNAMPFKLIAVEPEPDNFAWTIKHFRDNNIDPDEQWLLQMAISDSHLPVLFPIGSPGTGAQNCISTNEPAARQCYARQLIQSGRVDEALERLMIDGTTGITKTLVPGHDFQAEIKLVSAVTLGDVLGPFDLVDYIESDIQQSESVVFAPFRNLLKRKVRRIHIGTHGRDVHWTLHRMFESDGWEIVFSFEPNAKHETAVGTFEANDGVLTVRNRAL